MAHLFGQNLSKTELLRRVGSVGQIAGISKVERTDGVERGNRVLEVRTGSGLTFTVLPDRGLDISDFSFQGIPCVWKSPNGEVAPSFFESDGLGWLRSFQGGLFSTCGLTHFGSPCDDDGERLGIHGRIGNTPAYDVNTDCTWVGDELMLSIRGRIRQSRVFGENLVLARVMTTSLGSTEVAIEDTVTNEGFDHTPHMMLYHFNLGYPLVDACSQLTLPVDKTFPRDADAEHGLSEWNQFTPPQSRFREQVFRHQTHAVDDYVRLELLNPDIGIRWQLTYRKSQLPHLFQWRMYGEGIYVLGLEPANSSAIHGRAHARDTNDLPMLAPGESRVYQFVVSVSRT